MRVRREALRDALEFVRDVLPCAPPVVVCLDTVDDPPPLIWSDAMFEEGAALEDGGGFVVLKRARTARPLVFVGCGHTPHDVRDHFVAGRRSYIGQLELLYAVAP